MVEVTCVVDAKAALGESTFWDPVEQVLWWIDIWGPTIHRYNPATNADDTWTAPEYLGCLLRDLLERLDAVCRKAGVDHRDRLHALRAEPLTHRFVELGSPFRARRGGETGPVPAARIAVHREVRDAQHRAARVLPCRIENRGHDCGARLDQPHYRLH